jgi:hypothetical protein
LSVSSAMKRVAAMAPNDASEKSAKGQSEALPLCRMYYSRSGGEVFPWGYR